MFVNFILVYIISRLLLNKALIRCEELVRVSKMIVSNLSSIGKSISSSHAYVNHLPSANSVSSKRDLFVIYVDQKVEESSIGEITR
jgi:hypothetical protein